METLRTNENEICFSMDGFIYMYKIAEKIKLDEDGVKYYRHCHEIADGCRGRAIVQVFSDGREVWKISKRHNVTLRGFKN